MEASFGDLSRISVADDSSVISSNSLFANNLLNSSLAEGKIDSSVLMIDVRLDDKDFVIGSDNTKGRAAEILQIRRRSSRNLEFKIDDFLGLNYSSVNDLYDFLPFFNISIELNIYPVGYKKRSRGFIVFNDRTRELYSREDKEVVKYISNFDLKKENFNFGNQGTRAREYNGQTSGIALNKMLLDHVVSDNTPSNKYTRSYKEKDLKKGLRSLREQILSDFLSDAENIENRTLEIVKDKWKQYPILVKIIESIEETDFTRVAKSYLYKYNIYLLNQSLEKVSDTIIEARNNPKYSALNVDINERIVEILLNVAKSHLPTSTLVKDDSYHIIENNVRILVGIEDNQIGFFNNLSYAEKHPAIDPHESNVLTNRQSSKLLDKFDKGENSEHLEELISRSPTVLKQKIRDMFFGSDVVLIDKIIELFKANGYLRELQNIKPFLEEHKRKVILSSHQNTVFSQFDNSLVTLSFNSFDEENRHKLKFNSSYLSRSKTIVSLDTRQGKSFLLEKFIGRYEEFINEFREKTVDAKVASNIKRDYFAVYNLMRVMTLIKNPNLLEKISDEKSRQFINYIATQYGVSRKAASIEFVKKIIDSGSFVEFCRDFVDNIPLKLVELMYNEQINPDKSFASSNNFESLLRTRVLAYQEGAVSDFSQDLKESDRIHKQFMLYKRGFRIININLANQEELGNLLREEESNLYGKIVIIDEDIFIEDSKRIQRELVNRGANIIRVGATTNYVKTIDDKYRVAEKSSLNTKRNALKSEAKYLESINVYIDNGREVDETKCRDAIESCEVELRELETQKNEVTNRRHSDRGKHDEQKPFIKKMKELQEEILRLKNMNSYVDEGVILNKEECETRREYCSSELRNTQDLVNNEKLLVSFSEEKADKIRQEIARLKSRKSALESAQEDSRKELEILDLKKDLYRAVNERNYFNSSKRISSSISTGIELNERRQEVLDKILDNKCEFVEKDIKALLSANRWDELIPINHNFRRQQNIIPGLKLDFSERSSDVFKIISIFENLKSIDSARQTIVVANFVKNGQHYCALISDNTSGAVKTFPASAIDSHLSRDTENAKVVMIYAGNYEFVVGGDFGRLSHLRPTKLEDREIDEQNLFISNQTDCDIDLIKQMKGRDRGEHNKDVSTNLFIDRSLIRASIFNNKESFSKYIADNALKNDYARTAEDLKNKILNSLVKIAKTGEKTYDQEKFSLLSSLIKKIDQNIGNTNNPDLGNILRGDVLCYSDDQENNEVTFVEDQNSKIQEDDFNILDHGNGNISVEYVGGLNYDIGIQYKDPESYYYDLEEELTAEKINRDLRIYTLCKLLSYHNSYSVIVEIFDEVLEKIDDYDILGDKGDILDSEDKIKLVNRIRENKERRTIEDQYEILNDLFRLAHCKKSIMALRREIISDVAKGKLDRYLQEKQDEITLQEIKKSAEELGVLNSSFEEASASFGRESSRINDISKIASDLYGIHSAKKSQRPERKAQDSFTSESLKVEESYFTSLQKLKETLADTIDEIRYNKHSDDSQVSYSGAMQNLRREVELLNTKLKASEEEISGLRHSISESSNVRDQLSQDLRSEKNARTVLEESRLEIEAKYKSFEENMKRKIANLGSELEKLRNKSTNKTQQDALKIKELEQELSTLRVSYSSKEAIFLEQRNRIEELTIQLDKTKFEERKTKEDIKNISDEISQTKERLISINFEKLDLEKQIRSYKDKINELVISGENSQKELTKLKKEYQSLNFVKQDLESEVQVLKAQLKSMENSKIALEKSLEENKEYVEVIVVEAQNLVAEFESYKEENRSLNASLTSSLLELEIKKARIQRLEKEQQSHKEIEANQNKVLEELREETKILNKRIVELEHSSVKELDDTKRRLDLESKNLQEKKQLEIQSLNQQINSLTNEKSSNSIELENLKRELELVKVNYLVKENNLNSQQQELKDTKDKLNNLSKQNRDLNDDLSSLRSEIAAVRNNLEKNQKELLIAQEKNKILGGLEAEIIAMKNKESSLKEVNKALEEKERGLTQELNETRLSFFSLNEEMKDLRKNLDDQIRINKDLDSARNQIEISKQNLELAIEKLREEKNKKQNDLVARINELESKSREDAKGEEKLVEDLKRQLLELNSKYDLQTTSLQTQQEEIKKLNSSLLKADSERDEALGELSALTSSYKISKDYILKNDQYIRELEQHKERQEEIISQLKQNKIEPKELLEKQIGRLSASIEEKELEIAALNSQNKSLEEAKQIIIKEREELKLENKLRERTISELTSNIENVTNDLNNQIEQNNSLRSANKSLSKQIELIKKELERLEIEKNKEISALKNSSAELKSDLDKIDTKYREKEHELSEKIKDLEEKEKELSDLGKNMSELSLEHSKCEKAITEKSIKISELEEEVELYVKIMRQMSTESAQTFKAVQEKDVELSENLNLIQNVSRISELSFREIAAKQLELEGAVKKLKEEKEDLEIKKQIIGGSRESLNKRIESESSEILAISDSHEEEDSIEKRSPSPIPRVDGSNLLKEKSRSPTLP